VSKHIFDIQIVDLGVGVPGTQSGGQVIVEYVYMGEAECYCCGVGGVGTGVSGVPLDYESGFQGWDVDLFGVSTRIDEDGLGV